MQLPVLCPGNGPVPPKLIKNLQIRASRDNEGKVLCCPPDRSALPPEALLPTRRQKIGKQFGLCHSQQMLGTIRINGLETQVRAIQKLLITSKTTLYGGKG